MNMRAFVLGGALLAGALASCSDGARDSGTAVERSVPEFEFEGERRDASTIQAIEFGDDGLTCESESARTDFSWAEPEGPFESREDAVRAGIVEARAQGAEVNGDSFEVVYSSDGSAGYGVVQSEDIATTLLPLEVSTRGAFSIGYRGCPPEG